ncbi:MAG TPA: hypothetical protein DCR95_11510, partial [Desulfobacter sp.]|nr:hypothetical protein [Desulfobacter sp.]
KNVKNEKNEKNTNPPIAPQDDFSVFWQEYPKKVGKMDALKAWGKLNGTRPAIEIILNAIHAQKQSAQWQKEGGQFIPNPATWLNRGQWEDQGVQLAVIPEQTRKNISTINNWLERHGDE